MRSTRLSRCSPASWVLSWNRYLMMRRRVATKRRYTVGHFPQSFEHSCVGGWVVTRGAGQNSTYYGKIEDMVLAQEYITPRGILRTRWRTHAALPGPISTRS